MIIEIVLYVGLIGCSFSYFNEFFGKGIEVELLYLKYFVIVFLFFCYFILYCILYINKFWFCICLNFLF